VAGGAAAPSARARTEQIERRLEHADVRLDANDQNGAHGGQRLEARLDLGHEHREARLGDEERARRQHGRDLWHGRAEALGVLRRQDDGQRERVGRARLLAAARAGERAEKAVAAPPRWPSPALSPCGERCRRRPGSRR
jgi:hypothetical protein